MNLNNLMFPYDHILLILIIITILICTLKGFMNSLLGLLTWIGSVLITIYAYETFSIFLNKQILNINFFSNYEYIINVISIIISIPLIFISSLFILKRIRKFLSADLDKQILGLIIDKIFGFIYGLIFSYIILSSSILLLDRFEFISLHNWLKNNSYIIEKIDLFNEEYITVINDETNQI